MHTPGPWKVDGNSIVADEQWPLVICTVGNVAEDNRLIAAAPALLAACKEVLECAEQLIAEGKKLTNSGSTAAACAVMFRARVRPAIALAEKPADCS